MPCLNREILFDLARKLIEDGDQEAVCRFGLSGKEPFGILRNVFASVNVLQIFNGYYAIGWNNKKLCRFDFNDDKTHLQCLLDCVGESVKELRLGCQNMPLYSSVILNLIRGENISAFTVDTASDYIFASEMLETFSRTLVEVKVPYNFLSEKFVQLPLNFDSLIIMDNKMIDVMNFRFKKLSLTISSDFWLWKQILIEKFIKVNANMSSFTHLTFYSCANNSTAFADVNPLFLIRVFPSLEVLQFNLQLTSSYCFNADKFEEFLGKFRDAFQNKASVPSKMICNIRGKQHLILWFLDRSYDSDDDAPHFKCYRKNFSFHKSRDTVFEVQIDRC